MNFIAYLVRCKELIRIWYAFIFILGCDCLIAMLLTSKTALKPRASGLLFILALRVRYLGFLYFTKRRCLVVSVCAVTAIASIPIFFLNRFICYLVNDNTVDLNVVVNKAR